MECSIILPDNYVLKLAIESHTNAGDILNKVAEKMKIKSQDFQEFSLYMLLPERKSSLKTIPASWRSIKITRKIGDLWSACEKLNYHVDQPPPSFKVRRKIVLGEWPLMAIPNPSIAQLEFGQAIEELVAGRIPCNLKEATVLAVLILQALHGDYDPRKKVLTNKTIYDYFPKHLLDNSGVSVATLIDNINLTHHQLAGKNQAETRAKFLARMRNWKLYGASLFKVEQRKKPNHVWLAIHPNGVDVLEYPTLNPVCSWTYSQILSWNYNKEGEFNLVIGNLQNPGKENFTTYECQEIGEVIDSYIQLHNCKKENILISTSASRPNNKVVQNTFIPSKRISKQIKNSRLSVPKSKFQEIASQAGKRSSKILPSPQGDEAPPMSPLSSRSKANVNIGASRDKPFTKPRRSQKTPSVRMNFNFKQ